MLFSKECVILLLALQRTSDSPTRKGFYGMSVEADADVAQSVVHRIGSAGVSSSILDISMSVAG